MPIPDLNSLIVQSAFPGLVQVEAALARAWLREHGLEWDVALWNRRLGSGLDPGEEFLPADRAGAIANSQRRADLIVIRGELSAIVEFRRRIGRTTIGALEIYYDLWDREGAPTHNIDLVAVGETLGPDLEHTMRRLHIAWELFELPAGT